MLKETIKYEDYNGVERTEDHYFNLTKTEIMKMELGVKGGLTELIQRIISAQDTPALMEIFDDLIHKAYGVKSADGKRFEKNEENWLAFKESGAYDKLFMDLATDAEKAAKFINSIVPAELAAEAAKNAANPLLTTVQ